MNFTTRRSQREVANASANQQRRQHTQRNLGELADAPPVSAGAFLQSRFDDTFTYRENTGEPLASQGLEPYVAPQ